MSLEIEVNALATAIGDDIQALLANQGSLTSLNTVDKTNLVAAINEVLAAIAGGGGGDMLKSENLSGLANYVTARTNLDIRSTAQVTSEISGAVAAVTLGSLGGLTQAQVDTRVQLIVDTAPAALDTLNELAAALGDDANFAATMATSLSNKVDFSAAQTKTTGEKLQACTNLGIGDPEADYALTYTTARDS